MYVGCVIRSKIQQYVASKEESFCGETGNRTRDLVHAKHALYQLSYFPLMLQDQRKQYNHFLKKLPLTFITFSRVDSQISFPYFDYFLPNNTSLLCYMLPSKVKDSTLGIIFFPSCTRRTNLYPYKWCITEDTQITMIFHSHAAAVAIYEKVSD